jgi:hypothetical protein
MLQVYLTYIFSNKFGILGSQYWQSDGPQSVAQGHSRYHFNAVSSLISKKKKLSGRLDDKTSHEARSKVTRTFR